MVLTRKNMTDDEIRELQKEIREALPEVAGVKFTFDDDAESGGSSTFFAVKFYGQDTGVLEDFATEAMRRIETLEGMQDLRTSFRDSTARGPGQDRPRQGTKGGARRPVYGGRLLFHSRLDAAAALQYR